MKNIFMGILLTFVLVHAKDYREITWSYLKGKVEAYDDPFKKLTEEQLYNLSIYAKVSAMQQKAPERVSDSAHKEASKAKTILIKEGVDVQGLLAQREHIKNLREAASYKANIDLNNTDIGISGYLLNLSLDKQGPMQGFLLVPKCITCLHEPTPPPNQIAYIKTSRPIELVSHSTRMTIKGRIVAAKSSNKIYSLHGDGMINSSYIIYADSIERYSK